MSINTNHELNRRRFMKIMLMAGVSSAVNWSGIDILAAAVSNKSDYPIVVIGSGIGGLVSAAYMASAWSHGGGYVPAMMAGRTAFESLLKDWR